jgi:hypothetical protein
MVKDPFSYDAVRQTLERFSETVPEILCSHPATAKYSTGLHNLLDQVDSPFTVAVTGQMRVGKSTLLNALIGEDLAITGVNETTATINWFKHGSEELDGKFKVVWKDRPEELFSRECIQEWIGDSEKAAQTRYLEFFSSSELLKEANFIDTPGTRSVIESHEETINEFLAQRCEKESMRQGGRSDAIIYVFPVVARESDQDSLGSFGDGTRIPGSSPFNSIGVVHKWDGLNVDNPIEEAANKAATVAEAMKGLVCSVIPVSAPLYIASSERFDDSFWDTVVILSSIDDDAGFKKLVLNDRFFEKENDACTLTAEERKRFRSTYPLPWVSLRLILKELRRKGISDPNAARDYIRENSGIPRLKAELEQRFFSKSRLIKMRGCLNRAWEPCLQASITLRSEKTQLAAELAQFPEYLEYTGELAENGDAMAQRLHGFVQKTQTILRDRVKVNAEALTLLDEQRLVAKDARDDMSADFDCIEMLEHSDKNPFDAGTVKPLLALFGYFGADMEQRCSEVGGATLKDGLYALLDYISEMPVSGPWERVKGHAIQRINNMLDVVEVVDGSGQE